MSPFLGRWLIVSMSNWDVDDVNEEVRALIEFEPGQRGDFHFGYVRGGIDDRDVQREGKPAVDFSWDGNDERDPAQGRGWAVLNGERLNGMICFHQGRRDRVRGGTGSRQGRLTVVEEEKLKLGKKAAFVKGRLKALPESNEVWEADFRALPKPIMQTQTHYLGMVVTGEGGSILADSQVHGRPSVNDLATLLAHAMRRPLDGNARRPKLVRLRGHHQWREIFPHLEEIGVGVEVSVKKGLPDIEKAYLVYHRRLRDESKAGMVKPTSAQAKVEAMFPAIARYVGSYGYIEVGDQESFGFVVRAIGYGGTDLEDDRPSTLAEAMAVLEAGLTRWFDEQGVEDE